ncbi:MAG: GNAT family N-acetyltransferase [Bacteroidales bacterium]|jgi:predicted acetyltransferase|nr:GNAT family N-acetyltransferase [Bacteroidales bacterium]
MITFAQIGDKQELMQLWRTSFPADSEQFIQLYFNTKFDPHNTLIFKQKGKIIATLQLLPYRINYFDVIFPCSYISGAATLEEFRNQGIMSQLLVYALNHSKNRGDIFCLLFTQEDSLEQYYKRFGFANFFEYEALDFEFQEKKNVPLYYHIKRLDEVDFELIYQHYNKYCDRKIFWVRKTREDFRVIWQDYQLAGGDIFILKRDGFTKGIVFCKKVENVLIIKDVTTTKKAVLRPFLHKLADMFCTENVYIEHAVNDEHNAVSRGMARILNFPVFFSHFARQHYHTSIKFAINDEQISENTGFYCIKKTKVEKKELWQDTQSINPSTFVKRLTFYERKFNKNDRRIVNISPYMSLMLED